MKVEKIRIPSLERREEASERTVTGQNEEDQ